MMKSEFLSVVHAPKQMSSAMSKFRCFPDETLTDINNSEIYEQLRDKIHNAPTLDALQKARTRLEELNKPKRELEGRCQEKLNSTDKDWSNWAASQIKESKSHYNTLLGLYMSKKKEFQKETNLKMQNLLREWKTGDVFKVGSVLFGSDSKVEASGEWSLNNDILTIGEETKKIENVTSSTDVEFLQKYKNTPFVYIDQSNGFLLERKGGGNLTKKMHKDLHNYVM